jgi:SAM-dependent methyltransferase
MELSERSGSADDPFGGRRPTSHERMTGRPWNFAYQNGPAPWDIGHPQPAVVRLASAGAFSGAVLDVGCGTGENTLLVASLGLPVLGVDLAETALAMAREKVRERSGLKTDDRKNDRGMEVEFATADAFHLENLGRKFQTVLDCGMFHTCDDDERLGYVASLASVTEPGGTLYVLCFSDQEPDIGPHPVSEAELRAAFGPGSEWNIASIEPDRIEARIHDHGTSAWMVTVKRT